MITKDVGERKKRGESHLVGSHRPWNENKFFFLSLSSPFPDQNATCFCCRQLQLCLTDWRRSSLKVQTWQRDALWRIWHLGLISNRSLAPHMSLRWCVGDRQSQQHPAVAVLYLEYRRDEKRFFFLEGQRKGYIFAHGRLVQVFPLQFYSHWDGNLSEIEMFMGRALSAQHSPIGGDGNCFLPPVFMAAGPVPLTITRHSGIKGIPLCCLSVLLSVPVHQQSQRLVRFLFFRGSVRFFWCKYLVQPFSVSLFHSLSGMSLGVDEQLPSLTAQSSLSTLCHALSSLHFRNAQRTLAPIFAYIISDAFLLYLNFLPRDGEADNTRLALKRFGFNALRQSVRKSMRGQHTTVFSSSSFLFRPFHLVTWNCPRNKEVPVFLKVSLLH